MSEEKQPAREMITIPKIVFDPHKKWVVSESTRAFMQKAGEQLRDGYEQMMRSVWGKREGEVYCIFGCHYVPESDAVEAGECTFCWTHATYMTHICLACSAERDTSKDKMIPGE